MRNAAPARLLARQKYITLGKLTRGMVMRVPLLCCAVVMSLFSTASASEVDCGRGVSLNQKRNSTEMAGEICKKSIDLKLSQAQDRGSCRFQCGVTTCCEITTQSACNAKQNSGWSRNTSC